MGKGNGTELTEWLGNSAVVVGYAWVPGQKNTRNIRLPCRNRFVGWQQGQLRLGLRRFLGCLVTRSSIVECLYMRT